MALNSLFCADVPLSNYSLTSFCEALNFPILVGHGRGPSADRVGSQVWFYAIFADRVGSRVSPNLPKFVLKISNQFMYGMVCTAEASAVDMKKLGADYKAW